MVYLLKLSLAWALFLLLFEALYKSNGRFTANRLYLLLSLGIGLLLPLIELPVAAPVVANTLQTFLPPAATIKPVPLSVAVQGPFSVGFPVPYVSLIIMSIYLSGVAFFLLKCLFELLQMRYLIRKNPAAIIQGHEVVITGKKHAPYSFMGRIFIGDVTIYLPGELSYILNHEAAHNQKKHWLDLLLMQLVNTICWFHPLVWRYRYLLQLQHEYEADALAAGNDAYAYGHFLLQQTMLNRVPSIAHSFQFSPIKNRILMLTKHHHRKAGNWKYALLIPALLGCTFMMAKTSINASRSRQGNVTTYNGSTFKWRTSDTLYIDRYTRTAKLAEPNTRNKPQVIYEMNGEPVYMNEYLSTPASYGKDYIAYSEYLKKEFVSQRKNLQDSLTSVMVANIVIDKEGNVAYYDLRSAWYPHKYLQREYHPYGDQQPVLNRIMDKIITQGPKWKPAMLNGKPVNTVIGFGGGC